MRALDAWAERRQVPLYLAALALGAGAGLASPALGAAVEPAITPVLGLLLFATFTAVPLAAIARALRDLRFVATLAVVNFVVLPLVVWGLSRFVAADDALLLGVLLVLLTPCIDYVVVFAGLAGGDRAKLLAATPVLMLLQFVLLPGYLWLMAGPGVLGRIDPAPFVEAFTLLIVLPLVAAAAVQTAARRRGPVQRPARIIERGMPLAAVPAMMVTLFAVVASQIAAVADELARLASLIPLYLAFAVAAVVVATVSARAAGLAVASRRSVVFSAVTRNSLVVLPLALALPPAYALTPLAVVTQTLVELVVMVVLVAVVPRVMRERRPGT